MTEPANEEPTELTDEELDEELTIAATGEEDDDRDERFEQLLDEREHRTGGDDII